MTSRRLVARVALATATVLALATGAAGQQVQAAPGGTTTVTTRSGLSMTVSPVRRLPSASATVRVTGAGYDPTVGIYVALCVTPRKGQQPSPCGGGVNTSGDNPASAWISSNPPPYGVSLATPYRRGGRFTVGLTVSPTVGTIDCRTVSCSIVTRADHTHAGDRRFDVVIPVSFAP